MLHPRYQYELAQVRAEAGGHDLIATIPAWQAAGIEKPNWATSIMDPSAVRRMDGRVAGIVACCYNIRDKLYDSSDASIVRGVDLKSGCVLGCGEIDTTSRTGV